jgi:hypothetical protein
MFGCAEGEAHPNELATLCEALNDFILQTMVPLAKRITTAEAEARFEKKARMTWHQLQLESNPIAKKGTL